jgi:hypothetical protein
MATHGGARPGAGRPAGGLSESRRLLDQAIRQGMAMAVRDRHPAAAGTADELAMAGAAEIIRMMMHAGHGDRVLAIWAQIAPAAPATNGRESASGSPLSDALERLPGGHGAPVARQLSDDRQDRGASAGDDAARPADCESAGRLIEGVPAVDLPGQIPLSVDAPRPAGNAPAGCAPGTSSSSVPAGCAPAGAPPPTPTPPRGRNAQVIHPDRVDFDFLNLEVAE